MKCFDLPFTVISARSPLTGPIGFRTSRVLVVWSTAPSVPQTLKNPWKPQLVEKPMYRKGVSPTWSGIDASGRTPMCDPLPKESSQRL